MKQNGQQSNGNSFGLQDPLAEKGRRMKSRMLASGLAIAIVLGSTGCGINFYYPGKQVSASAQSGAVHQTESLSTPEFHPAMEVVEKYFKYSDEKNEKGVLSTLTDRWNAPNIVWELGNLEYIDLNFIEEETDQKQYESYLKNGRGSINGTTMENLIVFKVMYEVEYKNDYVSSQESGMYEWWFFLIRKDENSPWLIDDMGV